MEKSLLWKFLCWCALFNNVTSSLVRFLERGEMIHLFFAVMSVSVLTYFTFMCEVHEK